VVGKAVLVAEETGGIRIVACGVVEMEDVDPCVQLTIRKLMIKRGIMLLYTLPCDREELGENLKGQKVIDYNPRSCRAV